MSSQAQPSGADFDLDEDLFDFQSALEAGQEEDLDLEQAFAQFEQEEADREARTLAQAAAAEREREQDGRASSEAPRPVLPKRERRANPTPLRAPTPDEVADHLRASEPPAPEAPLPSWPAPETPAPLPSAAATGTRGWRTVVWLLIAMTSVNALVALVALRSTGELQRSVETVGSQVSRTATELMREGLRAAPSTQRAGTGEPGSPNAESHPTFELAQEDIQHGEFARARRRLYALLAIVDRLDPTVREEIEARANFLLARALHEESVQRWEVRR